MSIAPELVPARLRPRELTTVATAGLRSRPLRAALSAIGIAIGIAAMTGVLGISASAQAGLLAEIDRLGTNLLTVSPGLDVMSGQAAELPRRAPGMIARIGPVTRVTAIGALNVPVYRSDWIPAEETAALSVDAATPGLLRTLGGSVRLGRFLTAASSAYPEVVLGAVAAQRMGIDRLYPGVRVWLGGQWFYVTGILNPLPLNPEIDAAAVIGVPAAETFFGYDGAPTTIYVRTAADQVQAVHDVLAATANPQDPGEVRVSRPSDALVARAAATNTFTGLFVGLGALTLAVGGVGVANIMVIAVLERRPEIGLRRALGAAKGHIRGQFLAEAILIAVLGGVSGVLAGAAATAAYAGARHWAVVLPVYDAIGGLAAAVVIGALAGLLPAIRAARLQPTDALRAM